LIDAALGRVVLTDNTPAAAGGDEEVRVSVFVQGGKGTIRQGIVRRLIVRCELGEGIHIYGEPVPEGMIATQVEINGPPGLIAQDTIYPPTETLRLESMNMELPVWSGMVDIVVPFYPTGELASETRPLDTKSIEIEVSVRYQACNDEVCFPPKTVTLNIELDLDVVDIPVLSMHMGHGQRESNFSLAPHMLRLVLRKFRQNPLGLPRFIFKTIGLEMAAASRRRGK